MQVERILYIQKITLLFLCNNIYIIDLLDRADMISIGCSYNGLIGNCIVEDGNKLQG